MEPIIPALVPVESSNIAAVGYLNKSEELYIQFSSGVVYLYQNVPELVFGRFMQAESKGAFFDQQIKRNADVYPFTKLGAAPLPVKPEAKLPSFYDGQPVDTILTDAAHTVQRIVGGDREYVYPLLEHLAALLVARDDVFLRDIATMGAYIRQARRALGLMPAEVSADA